jgi:hypothetical protein
MFEKNTNFGFNTYFCLRLTKTTHMAITIQEVISRRDLRKFIYLPARIHKGHKNWLPNIYMDEWSFFNPKKNHSFSYCKTKLMLAYKDGELVGRIMGIISVKYNDIRSENNARWGYLECFEDQEVAHALLRYIEDWAHENGMQKIVGPYGFSDKDPQGLLIEGFEHAPLIASACNFPYLVKLVENEGYTKEVDCLVYKYKLEKDIQEAYRRIVRRILSKNEYKVIEFTSRKQIKPYIHRVLGLMNDTYGHLYGFVPLDQQEMDDFAARYLPILDPRFIKLVEKDDQIVAFIIALPHMTKGIQKSKGHLFPFGIIHIMRAAKTTKQLDVMLGAVYPKLQGMGLDVLMTIPLIDSAKKAGYKEMEFHLMLETNKAILNEMDRLEATIHKRFRVFQKSLLET